MTYRNEIKEMKLIIDEVISIYEKKLDTLELDELFSYLFFVDLNKLLKSYLDHL